mgnify:CR=1 FL=1
MLDRKIVINELRKRGYIAEEKTMGNYNTRESLRKSSPAINLVF